MFPVPIYFLFLTYAHHSQIKKCIYLYMSKYTKTSVFDKKLDHNQHPIAAIRVCHFKQLKIITLPSKIHKHFFFTVINYTH